MTKSIDMNNPPTSATSVSNGSSEKNNLFYEKEFVRRIFTILFLLVGVTTIHYTTPLAFTQYHYVFARMYYIPIILGSFWYGLKGGFIVSFCSAVLYGPHIFFQWRTAGMGTLNEYLEIAIYMAVGIVTGFMADQEKVLRFKYQKAADDLEKSYEKLKEQARQLLEKEQQLIRADRLATMGELAASLTHEVRNPLGSILGSAEILKDDYKPGDVKYEFLEIMIKEANRLDRVINNFLSFARSNKPDIKEFDINSSILDIKELVEIGAAKKGITINTNLDGKIGKINADEEQIKQAILNVLLNSIQAMDKNGRITISTFQESSGTSARDLSEQEITVGKMPAVQCVNISFTDNGSGIIPENMEKIFNPFFTTRENGTGLGLSITRRIIENHRGSIHVQSRVNEGTTFVIKLPLREF
ncbi:MAG: sensor histidine kinase [Candidatus Schekmanbacteria bacterium]|nr:sensor histidine kinase [Candidatus Schekmanbacteria bacterium]